MMPFHVELWYSASVMILMFIAALTMVSKVTLAFLIVAVLFITESTCAPANDDIVNRLHRRNFFRSFRSWVSTIFESMMQNTAFHVPV